MSHFKVGARTGAPSRLKNTFCWVVGQSLGDMFPKKSNISIDALPKGALSRRCGGFYPISAKNEICSTKKK